MFFMGLFWSRTNSMAALFATVGGFLLSVLLKFLPMMTDLQFLSGMGLSAPNGAGIYEIAFLDRMMIVFIFSIVGMVLISLSSKTSRTNAENNMVKINTDLFKTNTSFTIGSIVVLSILAFLYIYFW
jgi:SSS family solute:Na+ symporter